MNASHSIIILLVSFLAACSADRPPLGLPSANEKKSTKLPPCQSCTKLVESFKKVNRSFVGRSVVFDLPSNVTIRTGNGKD